ncbi:MAG: biopolymer transporter ExbD [Acidobacteriota bacterium]
MHIETTKLSDEIPTSPIADIAFLLIIFFMVAATFTATRGLDFTLPQDRDDAVVDPVESTLVEVQTNGSLLVDGKPLDVDNLLDHLRPILLVNPEKPVILRTVPDARYGAMISVLDELRQGREALGLDDEIVIAIPTEREISQFWM